MSTPPRRSSSLRRSIEKVGDVLHLHKESSGQLHITQIKHGCRSEEESEALGHLQEELQKQNITLPPDMIYAGDLDATLLRFLRARKLKVDATIAQLTGCIAWRKENQIDKALQNPFDREKLAVIRQNKPASYIGFDKKGRPIYVDQIGQLNTHGIFSGGLTEQDVINYHIQEMEYMGRVLMREASEKAGQTVDSVIMILDASGIKLTSLNGSVKSLFGKIISIDQDNYPETNGGTYVVNASMVFTTIWGILKPFIDKNTASKVKVLGSGARMHAQLAEVFDMSQLPKFLGGELEFEDCMREWNAKMDTALEEAQRKAKELQERKEFRSNSMHSQSGSSIPGTPTTRSTSAVSDTLTAAAALSGGYPSPSLTHGPVRRVSSGSITVTLQSNDANGRSPASLPPSPAVNGGPTSIPQGLAPIRLDCPSSNNSEYNDAEEFYTPRSSLSRASSTSSYGDCNELLALESHSQKDSPNTVAAAAAAVSASKASDPLKAAAINAKDVNVQRTPMAKSHPPDLATIEEQPGCKCTIM